MTGGSDVEEMLVAAIFADPEDDTPRMALADWYRENGDEPRAAFIELQLELGREEREFNERTNSKPSFFRGKMRDGLRKQQADRLCEVERFLRLHEARWLGGADVYEPPPEPRRSATVWRRGFVWQVFATYDRWRDFGPAFVRRHPVERVWVTDRRPVVYARDGRSRPAQWCWRVDPWPGDVTRDWEVGRDVLRQPQRIHDAVVYIYNSAEAAQDDLMRGMALWAREAKRE